MKKLSAKHIVFGVFSLLLGLLVTTTVVGLVLYATKQMPKLTETSSQASHTPAAPLDPLAIEAMRARSYPGGPMQTTQELGDQGGYSNKIISFMSDGLTEYALVSTPGGTPPGGGWPVIIFNHGYIDPTLYRTNGSEYKSIIGELARNGYVVIKPDYRGHDKSQGVPEGGHFSPVYAYDVLNLISSLKDYPGINPKRIGQLGHSLGGHVTLRADVVSPDVKTSAIVAGVVGDFNDILYNWPDSPMGNDRPPLVQAKREAELAAHGTPKDNPDFWNSVAAVNFVRYIVGPVQINHDTGDGVVPYLFSQHLVYALQAANKPMEFNTYPGNDHQFSANRAVLMQNLLRFFAANL